MVVFWSSDDQAVSLVNLFPPCRNAGISLPFLVEGWQVANFSDFDFRLIAKALGDELAEQTIERKIGISSDNS